MSRNLTRDAKKLLPFAEMFAEHAYADDYAVAWLDSSDDKWKYKRADAPIDTTALKKHLNGGPPIGVYLMGPKSDTTRLGVLDLDDHAKNLEWERMPDAGKKITEAAIVR